MFVSVLAAQVTQEWQSGSGLCVLLLTKIMSLGVVGSNWDGKAGFLSAGWMSRKDCSKALRPVLEEAAIAFC